MDNLRLVVGLIRVDREQIEISREDLLRDSCTRTEYLLQYVLRFLIGFADILRHLQRYRDFLIARQILVHIRKGQKGRILQQEAGKHQR